MNWSRTHTLIAGIGLIGLTNAVALVGVVYNRSGEPGAVLRLTQRELQLPSIFYGNRENSGITLRLFWRLPDERSYRVQYYAPYAGMPTWLDKVKLEALGFDTSVSAYDSRSRERYEKQLPREVLLVLEQDGPAYRRSLELATKYSADQEAKLVSNPGDKNLAQFAKNAREAQERETRQNSRLFVVDAGLESTALRAKYPDGARYAIVRGQVRPTMYGRSQEKFGGYIDGLSIDEVNVPFALRDVFAGTRQVNDGEQGDKAPFEATVAFGKRFEPWMTSAVKK